MAKKHVDPLKAKQKKQKIVAAVLGVLFVGLLVFQVPRVLKKLHPSAAPPPPASTTTPTGTPTLAAPTLGAGDQSPAPTGGASPIASTAPTKSRGGSTRSDSMSSRNSAVSRIPRTTQSSWSRIARSRSGSSTSVTFCT